MSIYLVFFDFTDYQNESNSSHTLVDVAIQTEAEAFAVAQRSYDRTIERLKKRGMPILEKKEKEDGFLYGELDSTIWQIGTENFVWEFTVKKLDVVDKWDYAWHTIAGDQQKGYDFIWSDREDKSGDEY